MNPGSAIGPPPPDREGPRAVLSDRPGFTEAWIGTPMVIAHRWNREALRRSSLERLALDIAPRLP